MKEYPKAYGPIASLISAGKASLVELDTVYGVEDAYFLLDILRTDAMNRHIASEHQAKQQQER